VNRKRKLRRRYGHTAIRSQHPGEFRPGEGVRIKRTHCAPSFRGKTGIIVRYVPFGKYYVQEPNGERILVDVSDLEAL
jgi:hypothetical protein